MYIEHNTDLQDATRTPELREADRQLIAKQTREFLARGGKVTKITGYVAPVEATTGYNRQAVLRGGRAGGNRKYLRR